MARLDNETIDHLAKLCRLACTDEEKKALLQDLNQILGYVDRLEQCDTSNVSMRTSVIVGEDSLTLREDVEEAPLNRETFFKIVPSHVAGLVKVPNIMEESV